MPAIDRGGRTSGIHAYEVGAICQPKGSPVSCVYDAAGRQVQACALGAAMLAFDGEQVIRANNWHFAHGPGIDDPLIGLYRHLSETAVEFYYIGDGGGRHLAVGPASGGWPTNLPPGGWEATGGSSNSFTFSANRLEQPTAPGLSFFRNRIYDQLTGRWTQEDPIGVAGGINLYQFNENNPVTYTDPFGLEPEDVSEGGAASDSDCPKRGRVGLVCNLAKAAVKAIKSSRAARREAMRRKGIPTSQQPVRQVNPSGSPGNRQYQYETPKAGGGQQTQTVTQHPADAAHPKPHWEAGTAKNPPRTDPLGRTRYGSDKEVVEYDP